MAHGFALALIPVSLWCDGASMPLPVFAQRQGFRRQSGDVPSPHRGHWSGVAGAGLARPGPGKAGLSARILFTRVQPPYSFCYDPMMPPLR